MKANPFPLSSSYAILNNVCYNFSPCGRYCTRGTILPKYILDTLKISKVPNFGDSRKKWKTENDTSHFTLSFVLNVLECQLSPYVFNTLHDIKNCNCNLHHCNCTISAWSQRIPRVVIIILILSCGNHLLPTINRKPTTTVRQERNARQKLLIPFTYSCVFLSGL